MAKTIRVLGISGSLRAATQVTPAAMKQRFKVLERFCNLARRKIRYTKNADIS